MDARKSASRRDLLKGIAAAGFGATGGLIGSAGSAAAAGFDPSTIPSVLQPYPTITANPNSESFWEQVKSAFVLPNNYFHFNTGTTGSMPLFSMQNLAVYNLYKSSDPRDWEANLNAASPGLFPLGSLLGIFDTAVIPRQQAVAAAYGANLDEIFLSYNTTDGMNLIFSGTPWNPGDRIITTNMEHEAAEGPIAWARDYRGVTVATVNLPSDFNLPVPQLMDLFRVELAKPLPANAKQYIVASEIFYKNGLRLPVKQLCQLAKSYGAYTIIDTAHGWGQLPINCHDSEADFLVGSGHKWLCGGPGTGICYIRTSGSNLPPLAPGNFILYGNQFGPSPFFNNRFWPPNAFMQLRGDFNSPAVYAMSDSFSFMNYVGLQRIFNRGVDLGMYLKQKITGRWGQNALWVRASDSSYRTALVSFNPFKGKNDPGQFANMAAAMSAISNNLANPQLNNGVKMGVRFTTWRDKSTDPGDNRIGLRVSTHAMYVTPSMIDFLFQNLVREVNNTGLAQLP